jgi:ATP-dependent RNA helicase DeaD
MSALPSDSPSAITSFADLALPPNLLAALDAVGYEIPSPIQAEAIPHLLAGLDLLGRAPTGTGKTAAFALPLLARIEIADPAVQVMVLTPTRELAIQVAEAFRRYASGISGFHVLPVYGGQDLRGQIRQLERGVHVVVGTPGRIMDHMRRRTLSLSGLRALVLDEADEMLRMGFIDEVEWILEHAPAERQTALFSATMPKEIERIARRHLSQPKEISIRSQTATADTIRQRYWLVSGLHKLDALTRILEVEPIDGTLIFVRTRTATAELAERLQARGYAAAAMNGDLPQRQREQMIEGLKQGKLDILVATDVAARGLDVERISHVINYDIPYDTEAYIHRIGRTGRAGRTGDAILFVAPRERRMLKAIEHATRQTIEPLELPTTEMVNNKRIAAFKQKISDTLAAGDLAFMRSVIEQYQNEHNVPALDIAAALATLSVSDRPLLTTSAGQRKPAKDRPATEDRRDERTGSGRARKPSRNASGARNPEFERFRIEVGHSQGVEPRNIVGAIANEAGLDAHHIGHIEINADFSIVELPLGMPRDVFRDLKKAWVCGKQLAISRLDEKPAKASGDAASSRKKRPDGKSGGREQKLKPRSARKGSTEKAGDAAASRTVRKRKAKPTRES